MKVRHAPGIAFAALNAALALVISASPAANAADPGRGGIIHLPLVDADCRPTRGEPSIASVTAAQPSGEAGGETTSSYYQRYGMAKDSYSYTPATRAQTTAIPSDSEFRERFSGHAFARRDSLNPLKRREARRELFRNNASRGRVRGPGAPRSRFP